MEDRGRTGGPRGPGTVRAAGIRGYPAVVVELGGDPAALVAAAGLDPAVLDHDELPISDRALVALLERTADELRAPDLGLRLAARHDLSMLGPIAIVIANSPTAEAALDGASRYLDYHSDAMRVERVPDPRGDPAVVGVRFTAHEWASRPPRIALDAGLGFIHRALGLVLGEHYGLVSVELSYAPSADLSVYRRFYGAPVTTDADADVLRVRADMLARPITGANPRLRAQTEAYLRSVVPDADDLVGRVRAVVGASLGLVPPTLGDVARTLRLHPRTLQRLLAAEGTTFVAVVDRLRRDEARRALTLTDLSFADISARLGLAEQAVFTRACRRWWGVPPRVVRAPRTR
ncbi:AraC family transcriptional regulator [Georgenia sp. TF02-10]|uniref:AraC family transcriptional regulator n=1 Tax=Georgenia sp. TF02-10 TaxID=2917725 RepID=UPI001FA7514D|nr:AraC family transcriptional regulator [Georgenia sp. TF02-10]UNX54562.1 AraC family transcriptional regulator [Georgenia sp. TF02-10]